MADGQQGFSSFDDLDKFLKQKPAVSSQQPAPLAQPPTQKQETGGGFKDFSDLDKFVSESGKPKKPPEKLPAWSEVFSLNRPMKIAKTGYRGTASPEDMAESLKEGFGITMSKDDPRLTKTWREQFQSIDPINHPFNFLSWSVGGGLKLAHEKGVQGMEDILPPGGERTVLEKEAGILNASLKDPSFSKDPKRKAGAERDLRYVKDRLVEVQKKEQAHPEGAHLYDPEVVLRAAGETYIDWETMGAFFKPMEILSTAAQDVKAARAAAYAINQAIGIEFSIPSYQEAWKKFESGDRFGALYDVGVGSALLFLPLMHHVMSEKGITQEQIRKKAVEELEAKKKEIQAKQSQKPPEAVQLITTQGIADMQYRIENGLPMMGIGRPEPRDIPPPDRDVLNLGEQNLQNRLAREDAKSEAQRRIGRIEEQQRELAHKRRIAVEQAKTDAEKRQLMAELDARGKALDDEIKRENERFKLETTGLQRPVLGPTQLDMPPGEPKKPFEAEPFELSPGSRPMTREEREDQWLEERRKRYTDQLKEEREQRLRAGEEFKVEDRRRFGELTAPPGAPPPMGTPPGAEVAPAATAEPLAPPPQTRGQIQEKIAAVTWENQELELRKAQAKTAEELVEIEQQQERNRELAGDLAVDRIAEAMEGRKKPQEFEVGEPISGLVGKLGELKTVT